MMFNGKKNLGIYFLHFCCLLDFDTAVLWNQFYTTMCLWLFIPHPGSSQFNFFVFIQAALIIIGVML